MDDTRFDALARGLESRLTRRRAGGLAAGALLALGLAADSDARKRKKKKKKGGSSGGGGSAPAPAPSVNYTCNNINAACGNTLVCACRLNKDSQQVCVNVVNPPGGLIFPPCQSQANCPAGAFCDAQFGQCASACPN